MAWTKAKTAIVVGACVLLATSTATITIKQIQEHRTYPWQVEGFNGLRLLRAPPQVAILPSRIQSESMGNAASQGDSVGKMMGTGASAQSVIQAAYGMWSPNRTFFLTDLPKRRFDFIASLPSGNEEALQQEVKRKFGVVAKREPRETDVLLLKVNHEGASGLKLGTAQRTSVDEDKGRITCIGCSLESFAADLEPIFKIPVLDKTGLAGHFNINLNWDATDWQDRNPEGLRQAIFDQLGLELLSSREPVDMLVVEKAK